MFESKQLQVKPVRRYRTPRYPSHADPDPTLHPTPVPYPASNKLLAAVAAMSIASSTSCSEPAAKSPAPASAPVAAPLDPVDPTTISFPPTKLPVTSTLDLIKGPPENPFTVKLSGLPHRTSPYGSGMPHYLDEAIARRAIEETFQEAGYHLTARHRYQKAGVALVADGYDVDKNVGYVVAHYPNLDDDAIISWMRRRNPPASTEEDVNRLLGRVSSNPTMASLVAEIQAAKGLPDPARREAAYRSILMQAGQHKVSLAEMSQLEDAVKNHQDFVAVVSLFDSRFHVRPTYAPISNEQALKSPDSQTRKNGGSENELETVLFADDFASVEASEQSAEKQTLVRLQRAVREYIAWARSQGAQ